VQNCLVNLAIFQVIREALGQFENVEMQNLLSSFNLLK